MRRFFLLVLFVLLAPVSLAFAANIVGDLSVTMPLTTGTPTGCQAYVDGAKFGPVKACGAVAQVYAGVTLTDTKHNVQYTLVNAAGETVLSPIRVLDLTPTPLPGPPTNPPGVSFTCTPAPCPQIVITITP